MTDVATLPTNKPPLVVLRDRLEQRRNEIKNALPSDVSVDAFIRAAITSAQLNPEIQACSWTSLWTSCLRACRDGLLPDGQEGAIVPFKSPQPGSRCTPDFCAGLGAAVSSSG